MNAPAPRIVVTINADGSIEAVTEGLHGEACLDRIATLEALLDAVTVESRFTDDYQRLGNTTLSEAANIDEETIGNDA